MLGHAVHSPKANITDMAGRESAQSHSETPHSMSISNMWLLQLFLPVHGTSMQCRNPNAMLSDHLAGAQADQLHAVRPAGHNDA